VVETGINMHVQRSNQQDAREDEIVLASMMTHISIFREIVSDLLSMEVNYEDEDLALLLLVSLPNYFAIF
jgi:hypothetical protein